MKSIPLIVQYTVEFTASLPFSQQSLRLKPISHFYSSLHGENLLWCHATSFAPRGGENLLAQLSAHGSNRAFIGGTLERCDGSTNGFAPGFSCSPQLCSPQGTLCRYPCRFLRGDHSRQSFQAGGEHLLVTHFFCYCQTLSAESACRRIVTTHSSYPCQQAERFGSAFAIFHLPVQ